MFAIFMAHLVAKYNIYAQMGIKNKEKRRKVMSEEKKVYQGKILWFSAKRGYGFAEREGEPDIFCYWSNIQMDGFRTLKAGQIIEFEIGENARGPQAVNIKVIAEPEEDLSEE